MRISLIFPPQWDPRQPPLCIPTLAGVLKSEGHDVRAWDMNLSLYRNILFGRPRSLESRRWIEQYLSPRTLGDHRTFAEASGRVKDIIYMGYARYEPHRLWWDDFSAGCSPDASQNWKMAIRKPDRFPFFQKIRPLINEVIQWRPDFACISIISDTQIFAGLAIASRIRSKLPVVKIVLGGQALRSRRHLFVNHDWLFRTVDAICISHGEPTLTALGRGEHLSKVPNIIWYDGRMVRDPDTLKAVVFNAAHEPDFSCIKLDEYLSPGRVIPIESARGCPWSRCAFCGHPGLELPHKQWYVVRSLESVMSEIRRHISGGQNRFFFVDEAIPYERFRALSRKLLRIKDRLSWICYLSPEQTHTFSGFSLARRSGCLKVYIGIETGSKRLMQLYRKGSTPNIAKRIILDASRAGLAVHTFFITGFPDETEADRKATDAFIEDIVPSVDAFGFTYDIFDLKAETGTQLP